MVIRNQVLSYALTCAIASGAALTSTSALADNAGAFIGGVFAARLVGAARDSADAQQQQAQAAQYQAQAAQRAPAPAASSSPEARIKELDKLAAGGYITPEEYKAKKQAILDSM